VALLDKLALGAIISFLKGLLELYGFDSGGTGPILSGL
jgi:hypothetical protein